VAAHKLLGKWTQLRSSFTMEKSALVMTTQHMPSLNGCDEYLDGMTGNQAQKLDQLPPTFLDNVQTILSTCMTMTWWFGDVRSANIMITRNHKVKFVDFDWAGKAGVSCYPLLLSQQIQWPDA